MNEELLEDKLKTHDRRLNNHADRLDKLERNDSRQEVQIENLCKSIEGLIHTLKWGFGFVLTAIGTFLVYAIQTHLFG